MWQVHPAVTSVSSVEFLATAMASNKSQPDTSANSVLGTLYGVTTVQEGQAITYSPPAVNAAPIDLRMEVISGNKQKQLAWKGRKQMKQLGFGNFVVCICTLEQADLCVMQLALHMRFI